jgi:heme-degrading monooxygenase HmoA
VVLEVALIDVAPGGEEAFRAAYAQGREHLAGSPGCRSVRMTQGVETPTRFVLLVEWVTIAAHEAFRASGAFGAWRGHVGPHFAHPPRIEHFADV